MKSHKNSKYLTSRVLLGATAFGIGLATQSAWSGTISYNFSQNPENQVLDNTTPKGPLNSTFWNDSNAEGAPATGSETGLVDQSGTATSAAISWNSANTWSNGSGTASENARIVVGYLDDGGAGVSVNLTAIPYARYNVYGIVGSDQSGDNYASVDFNVNGKWAFAAAQQQLDNSGSTGNAGDSLSNSGTTGILPGALAGSSDPAFAFADQSAQIPYSAALNPSGSFTVECWINPTDLTAASRVLVQAMINGQNTANADDRSGWAFRQNGDALTFLIGGTGPLGGSVFYTTTATTAAGVITAGAWQHVAVVYNSSTLNVSIYVNGTKVLDTVAAAPLIPNYAAPTLIGNRGYGGWGYVGSLDEVAIYPSALTEAVISSHHANGINASRPTPYQTLVQASSPVGYWTGATFTSTPNSPGIGPAFSHWIAAGEKWTRIRPDLDQRGNYWKVDGATGSSLAIQAQPRNGSNRGSLSAVIIEEYITPDKFVKVGQETFADAALGAGLTSEFRPGTDLAEVVTPNALSVAATHNISVVPELATLDGTYKLIDYSGSIGGAGFGGLALAPLGNSRYTLNLVNNTADSSVDLVYAAPAPIVWAGPGTWDTATTANWKTQSGGALTTYQPYDIIRFNDTAVSGAITISGSKAPLSIEFNNSSVDYTLSGDAITGTTGLLKEGNGSLTLTGDNTFTGELLIGEGSVTIGNGTTGSISPDVPVFVAPGADFDLNLPVAADFQTDIENLGDMSFLGTGDLTISAKLYGEGNITFDRQGAVTMSTGGHSGNLIVSDGTILKALGGGWATSFFEGAVRNIIIESGGTMETTTHSLGGLGGTFVQPAITIEEGGTWTLLAEQYLNAGNLALLGGTVQIQSNDLRLFGGILGAVSSDAGSMITGGTLNLFEDVTLAVDDGTAPADLTVSSNIIENGGPRALTKVGTGALAFNGSSSITGITTISEGTLTGDGSFNGPLVIEAIATLSPGETIGSMAAGSAMISGTLVIQYSGSMGADSLEIAGDVDVTGGVLSFVSTGTALTAPVYPVITAGSVTGTFSTVTGTPAGYTLSYQSGGIFLLKSGVNPYNDWATGAPYNLSGPNALPSADPDKDGIPNAIEFVIGGNPASGADQTLLPLATDEGDYLVFNFPRSDASLLYGPKVEYGSTLDGWTNVVAGSPAGTPIIVETVQNGFGPGLDAVTVKIPKAISPDGKLFARLVIDIP